MDIDAAGSAGTRAGRRGGRLLVSEVAILQSSVGNQLPSSEGR